CGPRYNAPPRGLNPRPQQNASYEKNRQRQHEKIAGPESQRVLERLEGAKQRREERHKSVFLQRKRWRACSATPTFYLILGFRLPVRAGATATTAYARARRHGWRRVTAARTPN